MTSLEGGVIFQNEVLQWLQLLFEPTPQGQIVENPQNLLYTGGGQTTEQETRLREQMYSFPIIKQVYNLHARCSTQNESIVKALADNFLTSAWAMWTKSSVDRESFLRRAQQSFQNNTDQSEKFGQLPFCSLPDSTTNEIELLEMVRKDKQVAEQKVQELLLEISTMQRLLQSAAQDKIVLTEALETSKVTTQQAIASVRETEERRYRELQVSTDTLVAEKTVELQRAIEDSRNTLKIVQEEKDKRIIELQNTIQFMNAEFEKRMKELYASATKDMEIQLQRAKNERLEQENEFKMIVAAKLEDMKRGHVMKISKLESLIKTKEDQISSFSKQLDEEKKEFETFARTNQELQFENRNLKEGISLRTMKIEELQRQLNSMDGDTLAKLQRLQQEVVSLTTQLATQQKLKATELSNVQMREETRCSNEVARIMQESALRHEESVTALKNMYEQRLSQQAQKFQEQLRFIREKMRFRS